MANYNKVILAGNLTRDPQLSYTASNTAVCKFGLAVNRKWRHPETGENREETCFVDCTAFARRGEVINQYMSKGQPILLEGRLQFSTWEGQDGAKRSKLEVVVENFQFFGGRQDGSGQSSSPQSAPAGASPGGTSPGGTDDEVPF